MAKRYLTDKLIKREDIKEEIRLIKDSKIDYISKNGNVYTDYGNGYFLPRKTFINTYNGYMYISSLTKEDGSKFQRRVHILVAEAFLPNPNNFPYVCHKNDDKTDPRLENLEWGNASKNTKDAYNRGLAHTDKGYDDSQSMPVYAFNLNLEIIGSFGSARECVKHFNIALSQVLRHSWHKYKGKPRKGYYFRFQSEYDEKGFVF